MKEKHTIDYNKKSPNTIRTLRADLRKIGLKKGMTALVHASLSALGWVCGGPVAVILALESVMKNAGTLVMPTHTGDLSEPSNWKNPPVPKSWWKIIRKEMPAFDPILTPTRGMGIIAEIFRKQEGVKRSAHPSVSFAAWGKHSKYIASHHQLDFGMNEKSPLGKIYDLDGYVLLLGVNHSRNTSLHLAEYKAKYKSKCVREWYAPVMVRKKRVWKKYKDIYYNDKDFHKIGEAFDQTGKCKTATIGDTMSYFMKQRDLVNFAVKWMEKYRK